MLTYLICTNRIEAYRDYVTKMTIEHTFVVTSVEEIRMVDGGKFIYLPDYENNPQRDLLAQEIHNILKSNPDGTIIEFYA